MLATDSPFPQYFNLAGAPLTGGYLYFGAVGANPETSPVAVYWDEAGTQPAVQPLRTVGGYVARSGTPARLFVGSSYSLTVRDSRRNLIANSSITSLEMALAILLALIFVSSMTTYKLGIFAIFGALW